MLECFMQYYNITSFLQKEKKIINILNIYLVLKMYIFI
jgi:hypothetical protein